MHILLALTTMFAQACMAPPPSLTPTFPRAGDNLVRSIDTTARYQVDRIVSMNTRVVVAAINEAGGAIAVPASDGVAAELTYPANNACPDQKVNIEAIGPAGIKRLGRAIRSFDDRWQPFYQIVVTFIGSPASRIRFGGFPELILNIPNAEPRTIYAMRIEFGDGITETHIDTGPRNQGNTSRPVFDLASVPWLNEDGGTTLPLLGYRLIVERMQTAK